MTDPLTVAANIATIVQGLDAAIGLSDKVWFAPARKEQIRKLKTQIEEQKIELQKVLESLNAKFVEHQSEVSRILADHNASLKVEIEQLRSQQTVREAEIKQLEDQKAEIEKTLEVLERPLEILTQLQKDRAASLEAANWLAPRREDLAKAACDAALAKYVKENPGVTEYSSDQIRKFNRDIKDYLYLICLTLAQGKRDVLDKAEFSLALDTICYPMAFNWLIEEGIPDAKIASEAAVYITYLIKKLSPSN